MIISNQIAALQIIIPFFAALLSVLTFNKFISWLIATISIAFSLALAIYSFPFAKDGISYVFGGWKAPYGIEYSLDSLNQMIIMYMNAVLLFFLLFGRELINLTIIKYIDKKRRHIFYSLLLFAHTGYIGMVSTNDIFNLYVFIEISSLATYVLLSKGSNPSSLTGAFNYLMLGTIGATLILIGIGFFLALTGSLNIDDISNILRGSEYSRVLITAITFCIVGVILKLALFPMHFWMVKAYSSATSIILTYLAAISTVIGTYVLLRFISFSDEDGKVLVVLNMILRPISLITIVICTFLAFQTENLKKLVIYSTASQIGYVFLVLSINGSRDLLFQLLFIDGINKIAMFMIISHIECKSSNLNFRNFKFIKNSGYFKGLSAFAILFSAGLPITSMFLVKIKIYEMLFASNLLMEFAIVITAGIIGLLYHFKLARSIFFNHHMDNGEIEIDTNLYGLTSIIIVQFLTLLYNVDIFKFTQSITMIGI